jgi:predicted protein tyrosine phosphatase
MIAVCSHGGLARHCRRLRPGWMLSILGASDGLAWPLHEPRERHLRVACDDIQVPARGMVVPGRAHVEEMLAFLGRWDREAPLLVHCRAGTSRSTAAAPAATSSCCRPRWAEADPAKIRSRQRSRVSRRAKRCLDRISRPAGPLPRWPASRMVRA